MMKPDEIGGKKMLTPRVQRMKDKYFDTIPQITAERLVLQTEAYKKFAGEAVPVFRAKVVNYILENMTTLIMDDELIVGTATNAYRGANLHPEFQSSSWYISDIDDFSTRTKDPYYISPEDRKMILETLKYWDGKSMEDLSNLVMPSKIKELEKDEKQVLYYYLLYPGRAWDLAGEGYERRSQWIPSIYHNKLEQFMEGLEARKECLYALQKRLEV